MRFGGWGGVDGPQGASHGSVCAGTGGRGLCRCVGDGGGPHGPERGPSSAGGTSMGTFGACQHTAIPTTIGGAQLQPSTPTPASLKMAKMFRRSGPHLVPIWHRRRRKLGFSFRRGVKCRFHCMCLHSECSEFHGGYKYMNAKRDDLFLTPDLPHPALPHVAAGDGPPRGYSFFVQDPHICVFNMTRATRGSL